MSTLLMIDMTNNAILRKILVIARNLSARIGVPSALGALGRMLESCRPNHLKPSRTSELLRLAFLLINFSTPNVERFIDKKSFKIIN